jgi:hypothetical protein
MPLQQNCGIGLWGSLEQLSELWKRIDCLYRVFDQMYMQDKQQSRHNIDLCWMYYMGDLLLVVLGV